MRIEGTLMIVSNEEDYAGGVNQLLKEFKAYNQKFSTWAHDTMMNFGRETPVSVFPKIVYVHHRTMFSIVYFMLKEKKMGTILTPLQRELISMLERMMLFNITGDYRKIGDNMFTKLGLRPHFFQKGTYFYIFLNFHYISLISTISFLCFSILPLFLTFLS